MHTLHSAARTIHKATNETKKNKTFAPEHYNSTLDVETKKSLHNNTNDNNNATMTAISAVRRSIFFFFLVERIIIANAKQSAIDEQFPRG